MEFFKVLRKNLTEVYRYRYVTFSYVETNIKLRYRRSFLGFIWTMLAPMLHYLVIGLVFSVIVRSTRPDYFVYYFSGAVFFSIIQGVISRSPMMLIGNENYIKKIYLPKLIFVLNGVALEIVNFVLATAGLLVLGLVFGRIHLSWEWLILPVPVILVSIFLLGVASVISVLTVYFRDVLAMVPVVLQALFFLSPIAYDLSMVPERYKWVVNLNPFYYYLNLFREPLIEHRFANPSMLLMACGLSLTSCFIGVWVFQKYDNRIVFKL